MDREKIIKGLEQFKADLKPFCGSHADWKRFDAGLAMLKEQNAVEPIVTPWVEDEEGNIVVAKRECGKCRYQFFTERPNFCENCGTPILWEGR